MKSSRKTIFILLPTLLVLACGILYLANVQVWSQDSQNPPTWTDADVGAFAVAGGVQSDNSSGTYVLSSSGAGIGGYSDSFNYYYISLDGDIQVVARVAGWSGTNGGVAMGLMVRETLSPDSRNAAILMMNNQSLQFQCRPTADGDTESLSSSDNMAVPHWVKIVRKGDWIGSYESMDGQNWTLLDWTTLNGLSSRIYIGLVATGNDVDGSIPSSAFDQVSIGQPGAAEVVNPVIGTGDGLAADYFDNRHLFGAPANHRIDPLVAFNFKVPGTLGLDKTNEFGIRWFGEIQAQFSEPYTLFLKTEDGVRLWLNEQIVIDNWTCHSNKEMSATMNLVAGQRYLLRVEYFQNHGNSKIQLSWSSPSTSKRWIPPGQLYSQPTDTDGNGLPDLWEQHYFGQTGVDPNADPDGDGLSNLQEYQQHTDPLNPLRAGVPNEWGHGDIDNRAYSDASCGDASYSNGVFSVSSKGRDIWLREDDFHYLYRPLGTNGELVTRVLGITGVNAEAKAGLMVRETLDKDSRNVMVALTQDNNLTFQYRLETSDLTGRNQLHTNQLSLDWFKLVRNNDWVGAYVSTDGTNWMLYDWQVLKGLPAQVYIGFAVTAHSHKGTRSPTIAQFDQVAVAAATNDALNPVTGNGDGLLANYRNDSLLYLPGVTNAVDAGLNFDWIHNAPVDALEPDYYGVCWSGEVQAQFTEPYSFSLQCRAEDWVRVWVNEQLIIDGWRTLHPDIKFNQAGTINLVAGQHYLIRVEMFNNHGRGMARMKWKSPSTPERLVPQSQLYSQPIMDPDGSGLPVIWEQIYFGKTGIDTNADPDGDGLSNIQEYRYHTNPLKADTDADGMPDGWEIAHGLDPQFNDAGFDYDNDGWNNLQKYLDGLDPYNSDINNDGLPDSFEKQYLGLDLTVSQANLTSVAASAWGAQATNLLGSWKIDGTDIYALDRRGGLDFLLTVPSADKYVLNIIGTQNQPNPFETRLKLLLGVDGQSLGQYYLNAGFGTNGTVELVLPYLPAGPHLVHVFWDGAASFSSLRIKQVKFLSVVGADANHNGIKDWADAMMAAESGLDSTNAVISSFTSPICLQGRDPYPQMMQVTSNPTNSQSVPQPTTDGRWYLDQPLLAATQTMVQASYQNGAVLESRKLQWIQINLLTTTNSFTIRKGDSLFLNALPPGGSNGSLQINYGTNTFTGKTARGIACNFTQPGVFNVTGTYMPSSGTSQSGVVTVKVVQQKLPNIEPAAWTGMQRFLNLSELAPETVLQADSRLTCYVNNTNANGGVSLFLGTEDNIEQSLVAYLGTNGPVLDSTRVTGFDLWSGDQAYTKVLQVYPDGSQLIEMLMVSSPVQTNVTFLLEPIVSGVIFEDGTSTKTLTATNFDNLGQCPVRFIRPATAHTSVCHSIKAYQGNYQIGYRH